MFEFYFFSLFIFFTVFVFFLFSFYDTANPKTTAPSPQSYPIIGNLLGFLRNRHRFHDWVTEMLSQTPSSTLQVKSLLNLSNGICTANPINLHHLLVANFSNYIKGSRIFDVLFELLGYGIFNVDSHLWVAQRKISSYEFNTRSLRFFVSDIVDFELRNSLFPRLLNLCDDESVFDLQNLLSKFSFTTICKLAFGVDPESIPDLPFAKAFDDAVEICFCSRLLAPFPHLWKLKRFFSFGSEKRLKESIQTINDFAMEIIRSKLHEQETNKNQDLLSRFIQLSSNMDFEDEHHRTKFLRDIVISFVLAGKDTTSSALTWFFWLVAGNRRCEESIYRELSEVAPASDEEEERAKFGMRIFSYEELKKLDYLHAALSETMRLFPPVPINSRSTLADDVLPDGTYVRKGWFADYSAYAMGRMERVWGNDCREFKPERWLNGGGKYEPSDQFRFPAFHCGPRTCLGKDLAYVQMKAIVAAVMYEFEIVAVDGGANAERMMNPPYQVSLILKMDGGLHVRLKRRERHI